MHEIKSRVQWFCQFIDTYKESALSNSYHQGLSCLVVAPFELYTFEEFCVLLNNLKMTSSLLDPAR